MAARNDGRISAWDLSIRLLAIFSVLLSGAVAYSARLVVERSDAADSELQRRVAVLEMAVNLGILPVSQARVTSLERELARIDREIERLRDDRNAQDRP